MPSSPESTWVAEQQVQEMKRRDYARRIINPYLDFKQTILKAYHCGRAARNAAKFTGSHNSIKLKLCCLAFLRELNGDRGRNPTAALKLFLAWALHCWGLQRICTHPADPKSSELVRLWSVIPAWLWAAPPIYIPLLSRSWMPQEQLTDGPASLGLCCPELCCAKRSSSCSLSFLTAAPGLLYHVTIWISDGLHPIASALNSTSIWSPETNWTRNVTIWGLLKWFTTSSTGMNRKKQKAVRN